MPAFPASQAGGLNYREQLKRGIDVAICHPKLVETGLDLLDFPTILFHETGYSLHTLRQASRRSWRIGQKRPGKWSPSPIAGRCRKSVASDGQEVLVALAMEGKFASEGCKLLDGDDDMLTAMARELVQNRGIGESADSLEAGRRNPAFWRIDVRSGANSGQRPMDLFGSDIGADSAPIPPSIDFNSTSSPTLQLSLF